MIEKVIWKSEYAIGVEEIDDQHHYFSLLINRLMDKLSVSQDDSYSLRLLQELAMYASFHFISEENLMMSCNYPNLKEHIELHRLLIHKLNEKINFFKLAKLSHEGVINFLIEWFISHTVEIDREFGLFLTGR